MGDALFAKLKASLSSHPGLTAPNEGNPARAAVALTLRDSDHGAELLLIRRAEREGDPWSGQVALPGGRHSPGDASLLDTALRETLEETGLDIRQHGEILGQLDELRPRTATLPPIIVTPVVTVVQHAPVLVLSDEVAEAFWVPWTTLRDPSLDRESEVRVRGATWRVPSLVIGDHVVWGMTERILRGLFARVDG